MAERDTDPETLPNELVMIHRYNIIFWPLSLIPVYLWLPSLLCFQFCAVGSVTMVGWEVFGICHLSVLLRIMSICDVVK
jgi:hypothetical protein